MEEENRSMVWVLVVGVILVVVAVFLLMQNNAANNNVPTNTTTTTTGTTGTETVDPLPTEVDDSFEMTFDLNEQSDSGQLGTATFKGEGDQVEVTISLGNPNATAQPAHIHVGRCPTPGAVVFPLTAVVNGTSVTTLNTSLENLISQGELALNVHKSEAESSVYVACGDLAFE
jgi:multisubunit Na+/H+ antiporter MnhC subunit